MSPNHVPRLAQGLLGLCLPKGLVRDSLLGDLQEEFAWRTHAASQARARIWYWRQVVVLGPRYLWERLWYRRTSVVPRHDHHGRHRRGTVFESFTRDARLALRGLRRNPGFTTIAVISLALGIGPLTAIGSFVNVLFFRPLPHVEAPDRLATVFMGRGGFVSYLDLVDIREQVDAFEDVTALSLLGDFNVTDASGTRRARGGSVGPNYFQVLQVPLLMGRGLASDEFEPASEPVAVISHSTWRRHFGADAAVLGRVIKIDGKDHTIIGVTPEGLLSPEMPVELAVYVPLRVLHSIGRLRDGVSIEQARVQLAVLQQRLQEAHPDHWFDDRGRGYDLAVFPIRALRVGPRQQAQATIVLSLAVILGLLVLATACSNLANLLLARGWKRSREIAIRLAIGAGRRSLVSMLLVESLILGCAGGALGLLVTHWCTQWIATGVVGPGLDLTLDIRVLAFVAVVSMATGILFGLIPSLQASRPDLTVALKDERTSIGHIRGLSFRNVLVVGQISASLVLLVSAAVVVRGLQRAQSIDLGFEPEGVMAVEFNLTQGGYSQVQGENFLDDLVARLEATPSVAAVSLTSVLPFSGMRWGGSIVPEGTVVEPNNLIVAFEGRVDEDYFGLLRMPLLDGRPFTALDVQGSMPVVVVNATLAHRFWRDATAVGRRLQLDSGEWAEVVGVVRDAKYGNASEDPTLHYWRPLAQAYRPTQHLLVRARGDVRDVIPTVRELVSEMAPGLPFLEPRLMSAVINESNFDKQMTSAALAAGGVVALVLAVVGIYGVLTFVVSLRTHEVGVRIALGANPGDVVRMVLGEGVRLIGIGLAIGLLMAFGIVRLLASSMHGIDVMDPIAPGAGVAVLSAAALIATLVPALRASRVDPVEALRQE
jgi:predicted permease